MKIKVKAQIEGYREIENEITVLRKYSARPTTEKGQVYEAIDRYHPSHLKLIVSEIIKETESATTLRLIPANGYLPPFQAGQYLNLFVDINGVSTSRPYSISSPPNQIGYYDITVRRVAEGFVSDHLLGNIHVGSKITSTAPAGNFYYNPLLHGEDLVFIAGGSGITPFMSMIREVTDCGKARKIHLLYGNRTPSDIIFNDALAEREQRHHSLKITHILSEANPEFQGERGFITAKLIERLIPDPGQKTFYLCGPEAMYTFVLRELETLGIPKRKIRVEVFGPPARIDQHPGWPEQIKREDRFHIRFTNGFEFEASAGEPLLNALERSGKTLPASCRSGECSLCRTKLLSGKVFQPATVKLRKSDRKYNYIHPCLSYPLTDLELML